MTRKINKKFLYVFVIIVVLLGGMITWLLIDDGGSETTSTNIAPPIQQPTNTATSMKTYTQPFALTIDQTKKYTAIIKTSAGDITVDLAADATPNTVNNFVNLAQDGFYDNTIFHRAIKDFMIQGGDPKGDGTGGPGYRFADEQFVGEYTRGTIAMANAGPNTNGSQFFIMHADYALPKNYVIFGKVSAGLDVVDAIATAPVDYQPGGELSRPLAPVEVMTVQIIEE